MDTTAPSGWSMVKHSWLKNATDCSGKTRKAAATLKFVMDGDDEEQPIAAAAATAALGGAPFGSPPRNSGMAKKPPPSEHAESEATPVADCPLSLSMLSVPPLEAGELGAFFRTALTETDPTAVNAKPPNSSLDTATTSTTTTTTSTNTSMMMVVGAGMPPPLPSLATLRSFRLELDALAKSSATRAEHLQEELVKAEAYIKTRAKEERAKSSGAGATDAPLPPTVTAGDVASSNGKQATANGNAGNGGGTIKLKIRNVLPRADDNRDADSRKRERSASVQREQRGDGSPSSKRRREASLESEVTADSHGLVGPLLIPSRSGSISGLSGMSNIKANYQRKKQRIAQHERALAERNQAPQFNSNALVHDSIATADPSSTKPPAPMEEPGKIKAGNQISSNVFWSYVDSFFKSITESDLMLLNPVQSKDPTPYIIPPLGPHYKQTWDEEDKLLNPTIEYVAQKAAATKQQLPAKSSIMDDASLIPEELLCGPLTERLVASLMEESDSSATVSMDQDEDSAETASASATPVPPSYRSTRQTKDEIFDIEERLKRELRFVGLLDDHESGMYAEESDEISTELRSLQHELRRIVELNQHRKQIIRELAIDEIAYQEYSMVVDEIDKQVDQAFQKREKTAKKKKKISGGIYIKPAPDGVRALLDRRRRLLQEFQPIFPETIRLPPTESVFGDEPMWATSSNLVAIASRSVSFQEQLAAKQVAEAEAEAAAKAAASAVKLALPPLARDSALTDGMDIDLPTGTAPASPPKLAAAIPPTLSDPSKIKPSKPKKPKKPSGERSQYSGKTRPSFPGVETATGPTSETASDAGAASEATVPAAGSGDEAATPKKPRKKYTKKKKDGNVAAKTVPSVGDVLPGGDNAPNRTDPSGLVPDWMYSGISFDETKPE